MIERLIVDGIGYILYVFILRRFFSLFGNEREVKAFIRVLIDVIFVVLATINVTFLSAQMFFTAITIVLIIAYSLIYKMPVSRRVYSLIIINISLILIEVVFGLGVSFVLQIDVSATMDNLMIYLVMNILVKFIAYVLVKFVAIKSKTQSDTAKNARITVFLVLPLITLFVIYALSNYALIAHDRTSNGYAFIASLLLVVGNIIVIIANDYMIKQKRKQLEYQQLLEMLDREKQHYENLYVYQERSKKLIHDMKNKMYNISNLLDRDKEKAKQEISDMFDIFSSSVDKKITGIVCIDALISDKERFAEKNDIKFEIVSTVWDCQINNNDICVLIGNLLDNAIEALIADTNLKERCMTLQLLQKGGAIKIEIRNTTSKKVELSKIDKTIKKDKTLHGYGINSCKEIVERYDGKLNFNATDKEFIAEIILQQ